MVGDRQRMHEERECTDIGLGGGKSRLDLRVLPAVGWRVTDDSLELVDNTDVMLVEQVKSLMRS
jgi:hypothetical protein